MLTLTASPIPRTLEMALTGIRDLSMIDTPPADRQPILTYVGEYDERAVAEAHPPRAAARGPGLLRPQPGRTTSRRWRRRLRELVPEARVAVAHGQMDEGTLEQVVLDFWERRCDVLVCTTIIESGIDMPTVNTLVVDRADLLGPRPAAPAARPRRARRAAGLRLPVPPAGRVLTEQAYERLRTIGEHTELGSGFKIAMRDLEIRGAGNLLGRDQSGHIAAVGYDLYVQMVAEAVGELKGERRPSCRRSSSTCPVDAHLPADYVDGRGRPPRGYRRLAAVTTDGEVDDIGREWADRFGPLPDARRGDCSALAELRVECLRSGVREVASRAPRRRAHPDGPASRGCGSPRAPRPACTAWPGTPPTVKGSSSWSSRCTAPSVRPPS